MDLGTRRIRSAGRTSGSIELTLPALLQVLEGVTCRLMVKDGTRPEIVLYPDLSAAQELFRVLWQKMRLGFGEIGELPDFTMADFTMAFFPPRHWQDHPPLAYADALAVLQQRGLAASPARAPSHNGNWDTRAEEALCRLLAFLAVTAGYHLGLQGVFPLAFGDAVAYLVTNNSAGLGADFERGMAHRLFWGEDHARQLNGSPFEDQVWQWARPAFRRVYDQFLNWQKDATAYTAAREKWYRALAVELQEI